MDKIKFHLKERMNFVLIYKVNINSKQDKRNGMKKTLVFVISFILLPVLLPSLLSLCGGGNSQDEINTQSEIAKAEENTGKNSVEEIDTESVISNIVESEKTLNEIRFGNWKDEDWYDNDYFRFLRKSIDDCMRGIENEDTKHLQEYKSFLQGQFFVNHVEAFLGGGVYMYLAFLDKPEIMYEAWVYSYVKEQTVTGYHLRAFSKNEETLNATKEEVIERMKEFPHLKLW